MIVVIPYNSLPTICNCLNIADAGAVSGAAIILASNA